MQLTKVYYSTINANYLCYADCESIYACRGWTEKSRRRAGEDGRRTYRQIASAEYLQYNSEEDYYYVTFGSREQEHTMFEVYRHLWKLFPRQSDGAIDWRSRGKVARINKYCPIQDWMHTRGGDVQIYGVGSIHNGYIVTETKTVQQGRYCVSGIRASVNAALDSATQPQSAINMGGMGKFSEVRHPNDLNYTREVISRVVDSFINDQILELYARVTGKQTHNHGLKLKSQEFYGGFYQKPILSLNKNQRDEWTEQTMKDTMFRYCTDIQGNNLSYGMASISEIVGFDRRWLWWDEDLHGPIDMQPRGKKRDRLEFIGWLDPHRSRHIMFPFSKFLEVYSEYHLRHNNINLGAASLLRHILSYYYYLNLQCAMPSERSGMESLWCKPEECGHTWFALFMMATMVYCEESLHGFKATFCRLFGEKVYTKRLGKHGKYFELFAKLITGKVVHRLYDSSTLEPKYWDNRATSKSGTISSDIIPVLTDEKEYQSTVGDPAAFGRIVRFKEGPVRATDFYHGISGVFKSLYCVDDILDHLRHHLNEDRRQAVLLEWRNAMRRFFDEYVTYMFPYNQFGVSPEMTFGNQIPDELGNDYAISPGTSHGGQSVQDAIAGLTILTKNLSADSITVKDPATDLGENAACKISSISGSGFSDACDLATIEELLENN